MHNSSNDIGTVFITGISVSGKTTLGRRLTDDLLKSGIENVKFIDGEDVRRELARRGKEYGYSNDERNKVALEIAKIASEYNREGYICVVCAICHLRHIREQMREIIGNVMEVYLECPVRICAQRDYKGQYVKAFEGLYDNFIGVTEPYQLSERAEMTLHTGAQSIEECSKTLFESVKGFLNIKDDKISKIVESV